MSIRTFAAIDVGSFELSMKIFEFSGKNKMREIDCIRRYLDLGSDTYATGKISNEKVDELCKTLAEFSAIMKSYKVEAYRAYGTSAIRESENLIILLDQIALRTGIRLEVLSNSEQRFLHYKSVASLGETYRKVIEQKTAILDIGGGSIQISLFENDTLVSTQNLRLGVLRIQDIIHHVNAGKKKLEELVDEMVISQLAPYKKLYLQELDIQNLIVVDDYISPWAKKIAAKRGNLPMTDRSQVETFFQILRSKGSTEIARIMDISEEKVLLVMISAVLTKRIVEVTGADSIWMPGVSLCDGMAYEYAEKIKMFKEEHDFEKDIVACALNINKRYQGSKKKAENLEKIAIAIYDSMKKIHGLGKRERLYLRIAAILQDCGRYVSLTNIGENSYNILMATEIIGLSQVEHQIVASIVRFAHSDFEYYGQNGISGLERNSYLVVAKLTAILRLANSLDGSYKQKVKELKVQLQENELVLRVETQEDITLETCFFDEKVKFFTEVFSITPVLKQKKIW